MAPGVSTNPETYAFLRTFTHRKAPLLEWMERAEPNVQSFAPTTQGDYELNRRTLFKFGISALAGGTASLLAKKDDDDDKHDKHGKKHGKKDGYFRQEDTVYLRQYYSGPRDLPPGLRKKYYKTGKLPPGWEKRFRPFPPELVQRLPPPPPYCERGYVDGVAVVYDRRTRVILDVLDLINVATGH